MLYTEKELLVGSGFFAQRLKNLHMYNRDLFFQVVDFIPNLVYINKGVGSCIEYEFKNNSSVLKSIETDELFEKGGGI